MNLLEKAMRHKAMREPPSARPANKTVSEFRAYSTTTPAKNSAFPKLPVAVWVALTVTIIAILFLSTGNSPPPASPTQKIAAVAKTALDIRITDGAEQNRQAVLAFVDNWAKAWSAQDVEGYLFAYAPDFKPSHDLSRPAWKKQRRHRLTKYRTIEILLTELTVSVEKDTATVEFIQSFKGDGYHEDGLRKRLDLRLQDSRWMITRETSK